MAWTSARVYDCKHSCKYPNPQNVKGLEVDFKTYRPNLKILWKPLDPSTTDFNWTSYAVIYSMKGEDEASCRVIPRNQTECLLSVEEDWIYPNPFSVQVVTHPFNSSAKFALKEIRPKGLTGTYQKFPEKDPAKLTGSLVGGVIAGLVLLIAVCLAIKWRKSRSCTEIFFSRNLQVTQRREDCNDMYYACYYPEGDDLSKQVASIVNYFRQSGYNVIMDVMVSEEMSSQGPTGWAESQIRKAKKVLVFLSPGLVNLAQDGRGVSSVSQDINRVWIELQMLRNIYTRNRSASKMVCIRLPNISIKSLPLPLWASTSYKWPKDVKKILKRLNDRATILPV